MLGLNEYLKHPKIMGITLLEHFGQWLPDRIYIKLLFRFHMGYKLDLKKPRSFSEKLQWLKLYNRKPEYTMMVDKQAVKDYVANIIGKEYIIPTLGVWDSPEEIEWDILPDQFVLKTTHGGGSTGVVVCHDKASFDRGKAVNRLNESLKSDLYCRLKEWPYKHVNKRVLAEKYLEPSPNTNDLPDYKFFCFNGEPKYCQVITGRNKNMSIDFFDKAWNHQPFHEPKNYPFAEVEPQKPKNFDVMWEAARRLSSEKPFLRVDFYDLGDVVYFGEITFFPTSGMGGFSPKEYDFLFGKMITLPEEKYYG